MLGHMALRYFSRVSNIEAFGTCRSRAGMRSITPLENGHLISDVEAYDLDKLESLLQNIKPTVVLNCIGIVKQSKDARSEIASIYVNSLFPHRLSLICKAAGSRLIHISTDCIYSGLNGPYHEASTPDPSDLYGRTKLLGEINYPNTITLRTSIVGPEIKSPTGLFSWFMSQHADVRGYTKAFFSGLTTVELCKVIHHHVIPQHNMTGIFNVSGPAISKYELLVLFKKKYSRQLQICPDESVVINRCLDARRFNEITGYHPPSWDQLVDHMEGNS